MKVYGIAYDRPRPDAELVDVAKQLAARTLSEAKDAYGVGFIGVHQGKTSHFIFVDWWAQENELHHHVFISPLETPLDFREATATGVMACVWDLAVLQFERDAWVDTVLKRGGAGGFEGYLERRMDAEV